MSAIVVCFDEYGKYWCINFCHNGRTQMLGIGFPDKAEAVAWAEHAKASAKKVLVQPSTEELEAMVEKLKRGKL